MARETEVNIKLNYSYHTKFNAHTSLVYNKWTRIHPTTHTHPSMILQLQIKGWFKVWYLVGS